MTAWFLLAALARAHAAEWPALAVPSAPSGEGRRDAAVVVAIEDYAYVEDVAGARESGEAWMRWLLDVRGIPADRVHPAFDGVATDHVIRRTARDAAAQVEPGGTLWFVYVGHGAPAVGDALLVGADAQRSADGITARSVPRSEVLAALDAGPQAHTVMLLDACFSGQTASGAPLLEGLQPILPLEAPAAVASRTHVLTAAQGGQYAGPLPVARGSTRPAFSYLALGGLLGWADVDVGGNRDGRVSARELQRYVAGALRMTVRGRAQEPQLQGSDVDLAPVVQRDAPPLRAIGETFRESGAPGAAAASPPRGEPTLDLVALAAEAAVRADERARAEQAAAEAQRRASAAYRAELDAAMAAFRARLARDFAAVKPLLARVDADLEEDRTPPEVTRVLDAFMERYRAPSITVGGQALALDVPELDTVGSARDEFWYPCGDGWSTETGLLGHALYLSDGQRPLGFGQREVSQAFWQRVTGENPSRHAACGAECPVDSVSFCDALAFANRLSALEGLPEAYDLSRGCAAARLVRPAGGYRLPTREEWLAEARVDGAARAEREAERVQRLSWGIEGTIPGVPVAYGLSGPRAWGHGSGSMDTGKYEDLAGSVGEWVWPARDGRADAMGGSWADAAPRRVEDLALDWPVDARSEHVGLRLVRQTQPSVE